MTTAEVNQCFENIEIFPEALVSHDKNGEIRLYIVFDEVDKASHKDYVLQILRTYYMVAEYPRKPIVMVYGGLGRGTYTDKKRILKYLRDRISRVI